MGVNIKGGNNSVGLANVTSNYDLNVVTPDTTDAAGFAHMSAQNDDGTVTGSVLTIPSEISDDYRLRVGQDQTIFNLAFEGTNQATGHLQFNSTGGGANAQANGFLSINSGNSVAASNSSYVRSYRMFSLYGSYPTYAEFWLRESEYDATFAISEWGLFHLASTTSIVAPTDGVYFRRLPSGGLRAIVNYNGTETTADIITTNVPPRDGTGVYAPSEVNHYLIVTHNDVARFWINDTLVASIECPASQPALASASSAPLSLRVYVPVGNNSGTARKIELGWLNVSQGDMNTNKPWSHALVGGGGGAYQVQPGSSTSTPITANYVNSTVPATVSLSNTTQTGTYLSLGGQYLFTVPATAAETDFIMFSFQNPAGTATLPGKTLYITSVRIGEAVVTTVLSGHYHYLQWGIGANASAITLATTTDAVTAMAYRRMTLGGQGFLVSAPIGTTAPGFQVDFSSAPLICAPGNYVSVIMRDVSNAATATGAIRGNVTIIGYFE